MNFAHPERFYLLLLAPAAGLFMWAAARNARKALARFGNPWLLERAGLAVSPAGRVLRGLCFMLGVFFLALALCQPQWGMTREKVERKGVDVVVALDTSMSMLAQDVKPSRLTKAKAAVEKLISLMKGDRIGIVVFAGSAFTICPLTLDYDAARMFLDIIDTASVPDPGTDIPAALLEAAENFNPKEDKHKALILISDGENLEPGPGGKDPVAIAEELAKKGIRIFTVGVGTGKGSSIPLETQEGIQDKTDKQGNIVITRLDENTLRKIALAGNGKYRRLDNRSSGDELADIYKGIAGMEKKKFEEEYQVHYEDRFQYFLGLALIFLAVEPFIPERRKTAKERSS